MDVGIAVGTLEGSSSEVVSVEGGDFLRFFFGFEGSSASSSDASPLDLFRLRRCLVSTGTGCSQ